MNNLITGILQFTFGCTHTEWSLNNYMESLIVLQCNYSTQPLKYYQTHAHQVFNQLHNILPFLYQYYCNILYSLNPLLIITLFIFCMVLVLYTISIVCSGQPLDSAATKFLFMLISFFLGYGVTYVPMWDKNVSCYREFWSLYYYSCLSH